MEENVRIAVAMLKESVGILNELLLFMFLEDAHLYKTDKVVDAYRNLRALCAQALDELPATCKQGDSLRTISGPLCDEVVLYKTYSDAAIKLCKMNVLALERELGEIEELWHAAGEPTVEAEGVKGILSSASTRYDLFVQDVRVARNALTEERPEARYNPSEETAILLTITGEMTNNGSFVLQLCDQKIDLAPRYLAYLLRLIVALHEEEDGFYRKTEINDEFIYDNITLAEAPTNADRWKSEVCQLLDLALPPLMRPAIKVQRRRQRLSLDKSQLYIDHGSFANLDDQIEDAPEHTCHYLKCIQALLERLEDN